MKKPKTTAQLKAQLDKVFSLYIRHKFSKNGMCECYTCGKVLPIKEIQNGHFVSRSYLSTRWSEDNCRPQCVGCNMFGGGKPLDFEERLKDELGDVLVDEMKASRHKVLKLSSAWYLEQIEKYRDILKQNENIEKEALYRRRKEFLNLPE